MGIGDGLVDTLAEETVDLVGSAVGQPARALAGITKQGFDAAFPGDPPDVAPLSDPEVPDPGRFTANEAVGQGQAGGAGGTNLLTEKELFGGKKASGKTAFEVESSAPIPGDLLAADMAFKKRLADWEFLSHMARAEAMGVVTDINRDLANKTEKQVGTAMKQMGQLLDTAEQEISAVDDLIDAARSNRINPGQFFANVGEAGKFAAALSIGAGAMASAFGGGPNVAFDLIQRAIDRNVRAQVVNQAHDRAMISHQLNFVHTIRGLAQDQGSYANLLRVGLNAVAQARVAEAMSGTNEALLQMAGRSVYDRLGAQVVQGRINQIASTKYKFKHSWHNWRKTLAAQNAVLSAMSGGGGQPQGRAPSALGPGPAQGGGQGRSKAPSEMGSQPQAGAGPQRTVVPRPQDKALVDRAMREALTSPAFQERGPRAAEAQAQAIADALQRVVGNVPGQKVTREMKQYAWETFGSGTDASTGAAAGLSTAIKGQNDLEFAAEGQVPSRNLFIPGIGKRRILVENQDQFNESDKKKVMQQISAGARAIAYTKRLKEFAGVLNLGNKLQDVVRRNSNGELMFPIGSATITESQLMAAMKGIQEALISDSQNTEAGNNALNRIWEIGRQERKTGARPGWILEIGDITGARGPLVRVNEMDAYIELRDNDMRSAATAAGLYIPGNFKPVLQKAPGE